MDKKDNIFKRILDAFASGEYDRDTVNRVHAWLADGTNGAEKKEAMRDLWDSQEPVMAGGDIRRSLESVYRKAGLGRKKTVRRWAGYAAAAALAAIAVVSTWIYAGKEYGNIAMVETYSGAGERCELVLPDGTVVCANSSTLLLYPERFVSGTRTVYLVGEADFKVKKDERHPFIVRSGDMSVTALGTEFNVSAYPDSENIVATLIEGKVEVRCGEDGKSYILAPGEQVSYSRGTGASFLTDNVCIDDVTAWQQGIMVFKGMTLKEIINTIQRSYNVRIHVDPSCFSEDRFNFRFKETAGLDEVMDIISTVAGDFSYDIEYRQ